MTTILQRASAKAFCFRLDFSSDSGPAAELTRLVCKAVAGATWTKPNHDGRTGRYKTLRGEVILAALTYFYASGVYSSREIADQIYRVQLKHHYLWDEVFTARSLVVFRRMNRDLIEDSLAEVFKAHPNNGVYATGVRWVGHPIDRAVEADAMLNEV